MYTVKVKLTKKGREKIKETISLLKKAKKNIVLFENGVNSVIKTTKVF